MNGTIFDIKEFAIYDGPGVRQTVFFKGCPLRCAWCHNPEGLSPRPQLGVSAAACTDCGKCRPICPVGEWDEHFRRSTACTACGECISLCPAGLRRIVGQTYTPEALAEKLRRKADYYARLGGGVTFSGGEPLLQADFLCETAHLLNGIHLTIETSGFAEKAVFCRVLSVLDYVLMDLKCLDDDLHKQYTGVSNQKILANYQQLRQSGIPHVIRIPLVEGVSCTEENLTRTAALLAGDPALDRVELLPYQPAAGAKYRMVGKTYDRTFSAGPMLARAAEPFEQYGLRCKIL